MSSAFGSSGDTSEAAQKTSIPGIMLLVVGVLFVGLNLFALLWAVVGGLMNMGVYGAQAATTGSSEEMAMAGVGAGVSLIALVISIVVDVVGVIGGGVVAFAGRKLMTLQSPGIVMLGAIVAVIQPVVSLCASMFGGCGICGAFLWAPIVLLGIGSGIWAFMVINDPTVRESFDAV